MMANNSNKLMIVRVSVMCFVILTASFTTVIAQDEEITPKIKVISFYKWYLHWTNQKHDLTKNKSAMEGYFSAQFNGKIYSAEGQRAGRSLFVDGEQWNDAWAKNVNVSEGAITGNRAAVKLMLGSPADKTLQIALVKEGGEWKIDGISTAETITVAAAPEPIRAAPTAAASTTGTAAFDAEGNLIIPQPAPQLTTADLAGEWTDGPSRLTTEYVYSGSGKSAGRDTTASQIKTTFKADGTYSSFFNSVRKKYETEADAQTGPYSINGRLLSIQGKNTAGNPWTTKWVIRGWLDLPEMTVLLLAGPWYDNDPIPEIHFTDFGPDSKYRGVTKWVRMK